jgi:hypothetical protein
MVQVLDKDRELKYSIILEEIIILEEEPLKEEKIERPKELIEKKSHKRALRKLIQKAQNNSNYLKEVKRIEDVKNRINFRNYAVY